MHIPIIHGLDNIEEIPGEIIHINIETDTTIILDITGETDTEIILIK